MNVQFDPSIDHYKVLGVKPESSQDDIKKAYRRLAKRYHPDSTGGDKVKESRFKDISRAYDILGDSKKRAQYDAIRTGAAYGPGASGSGFPGGAGGVDLGSIFSQMFQGGAGPQRGARFSQGQGNPFSEFSVNGGPFSGFRESPGPRPRRRRPASPATESGVSAERKIRLPNGAMAIQRGADVYSDVRLSVDQAILGTVVEVTTLSGKAKVKIPPGTGSGVKLRLRGKGAIRTASKHGDHFVTVQIDVPKDVDEQAKKLLIQFMRKVKK